MNIAIKEIEKDNDDYTLRITQEMRTNIVYQNKGGRGVGRIEISKGKVERKKEEGRERERKRDTKIYWTKPGSER